MFNLYYNPTEVIEICNCVCRKVYLTQRGQLSFWFCFTTVSSVIWLAQCQRIAAVSSTWKSVLTWNFWPTTWRWIPWLRLWWRQSFRHQSPILQLWRLQEFRCRHLQVVGIDHWVCMRKKIQYYCMRTISVRKALSTITKKQTSYFRHYHF